MGVAVDEAGEHGELAEVHDAGVLGGMRLNLAEDANFLDAFSFDQNSGVLDVGAFADIEELAGFDENGRDTGGCRGRRRNRRSSRGRGGRGSWVGGRLGRRRLSVEKTGNDQDKDSEHNRTCKHCGFLF
jgi:hypothetical protein